jgi:hypothetical protein
MICRYCGRTGRPAVFIRMHDGTHRCDDALHCQHRIRKRQRLGTYDDHLDPYEGKVKLGRIVLDASNAAVHDDSNADLARINAILACEAFVTALADVGCMVTRIPSPT